MGPVLPPLHSVGPTSVCYSVFTFVDISSVPLFVHEPDVVYSSISPPVPSSILAGSQSWWGHLPPRGRYTLFPVPEWNADHRCFILYLLSGPNFTGLLVSCYVVPVFSEQSAIFGCVYTISSSSKDNDFSLDLWGNIPSSVLDVCTRAYNASTFSVGSELSSELSNIYFNAPDVGSELVFIVPRYLTWSDIHAVSSFPTVLPDTYHSTLATLYVPDRVLFVPLTTWVSVSSFGSFRKLRSVIVSRLSTVLGLFHTTYEVFTVDHNSGALNIPPPGWAISGSTPPCLRGSSVDSLTWFSTTSHRCLPRWGSRCKRLLLRGKV